MTFLAHKFPLKYILAPSENFMEKRNKKKTNYWYYYTAYSQIICATAIKLWPNEKSLTAKHHQTLLGDQTLYCLATLFDDV